MLDELETQAYRMIDVAELESNMYRKQYWYGARDTIVEIINWLQK